MPRRIPIVMALSLVAALVSVTPGAGSASGAPNAADERRAPLRYVALGDSFSAASGVLPVDPAAPPNCLRSTLNYPKVLAERIGADLTDVTCGAAETSHFGEAQYDNVPPQVRALSKRTELVTLTIGGNDSGVFINAIIQCGTLGIANAGQGSPCKDEYGSSFAKTVRTKTFPDLVRALRLVKRKAPNARIAILSYPWIMPERRGCFPQMPVARGDVKYLRNLQRVLNNQIRKAAKRVKRVRFVSLNRISDGRDACQAPGTRWVEPVVGTLNPVIVHPNAAGERAMARRTIRVMKLRN